MMEDRLNERQTGVRSFTRRSGTVRANTSAHFLPISSSHLCLIPLFPSLPTLKTATLLLLAQDNTRCRIMVQMKQHEQQYSFHD